MGYVIKEMSKNKLFFHRRPIYPKTLKAYQFFSSEKLTSRQVELNLDHTIGWLRSWSNGVGVGYLPYPYSAGVTKKLQVEKE